MRPITLTLLLLLLLPAALRAQTVTDPVPHPNPISLGWDASPGASGYHPTIDGVTTDVGPQLFTPPKNLTPGAHIASVTAYTGTGESPPSLLFSFLVAQPPACAGGTVVIAVQDWTKVVKAGERGRVLFQLFSDFPIVKTQVRFGDQVIGELPPPVSDLRDSAGMYFSVPRAGVYNLVVYAEDNRGCPGLTTLARPVTVQ